jgi:hypothetical protein
MKVYGLFTERRQMSAKRLTIKQRKEIFLALVQLQDEKRMSITDSIRQISQLHAISEDQLRSLMEEGIDKEWPPLDEVVSAVG